MPMGFELLSHRCISQPSPRPRPLVDALLTIPPPPLPPTVELVPAVPLVPLPLPTCPPTPVVPPLALPLPATFPLAPAAILAALLLSASSANRTASSLLLSSSATLLSTSCRRFTSSSSISSKSLLAPPHAGFRISRWLCSVWLNIRVQVASKVEACWTVRWTVDMFDCAFWREVVTFEMMVLISRTRASSARRRVSCSSRDCWGRESGCSWAGFWAEVEGCEVGVCLDVVAPLSGEAKRFSSASSSSALRSWRLSFETSGVRVRLSMVWQLSGPARDIYSCSTCFLSC